MLNSSSWHSIARLLIFLLGNIHNGSSFQISNRTRSDFKYPTDFGCWKKCQILSDSESITSLLPVKSIEPAVGYPTQSGIYGQCNAFQPQSMHYCLLTKTVKAICWCIAGVLSGSQGDLEYLSSFTWHMSVITAVIADWMTIVYDCGISAVW